MTDSRARARAREAWLTDDPAVRAAELRERLRREPPCQQCDGNGLASPPVDGPRKGDPRYTGPCPCKQDGLKARLQLAAYCHDRAAVLALGVELVTANSEYYAVDDKIVSTPSNLEAWCRGLGRWGHLVRARAALASADLCWEVLYRPLMGTSAAWHAPVREVAQAMDVARRAMNGPPTTKAVAVGLCECVQALDLGPCGCRSAWAACRILVPFQLDRGVFGIDTLAIGLADACDALVVGGYDEPAVLAHVRRDLIAWALRG